MRLGLLMILALLLSACEGPTGPQGPPGESITGPQGPPGSSGEDGSDGEDGQDGQDGSDGEDGQDGQDGSDGQDGQVGKYQITVEPDWSTRQATTEFPEVVGTNPLEPPLIQCYGLDLARRYWLISSHQPFGHTSAPILTGQHRPPEPEPEIEGPYPECFLWFDYVDELWNATVENVPAGWKITFVTLY